jgi:hypothetical protein
MEDIKISQQSMGVFKGSNSCTISWAVNRLRTPCAIVADEIPCVDDLALNAPEGASVAKMIKQQHRLGAG